MGWNNPGGNGSKDPWGQRDPDRGPPDLDQIVRKMQDRLGGWFGRGRTGMPGRRAPGILTLVGIAIGIILLWECAYIIQPAERGLVLRFGSFVHVLEPGINFRFPRPIEKVEIVDIDQIRTVSHKANMLTQDENIVDIEMAVQYKVKDPKSYQFNVRSPDGTLRDAMETAIREVIGKSKMDLVLTVGRGEIAAKIMQLIQGIVDQYQTGLLVTSVNMQPAKPPEPVKSAFDDAIKAREDEQRLINEAEAYQNEIVPKARGAAARRREEAKAYKAQVIAEAEGETNRFDQLLQEYEKAPAVTRARLYLEAVESVLSNSPKVLVDLKSGNNLLFLPLDKLLERGTPGGQDLQSEDLTQQPAAAASKQDAQPDDDELRDRRAR
ncbi:MAG: FtsH protease activity modulator HflK [Gammaproteobacteria bacterium]|nr:FtsH protease activity modulator HflK [Gammaproteobacteria bacterium]